MDSVEFNGKVISVGQVVTIKNIKVFGLCLILRIYDDSVTDKYGPAIVMARPYAYVGRFAENPFLSYEAIEIRASQLVDNPDVYEMHDDIRIV